MTVVVVEPQPQPQVVYYQDPVPTYIEPAYPGTFKYGLFDTCCECCIHLELLFCWYLRVQTVAEYFGSSGIGWCLLSICFPWVSSGQEGFQVAFFTVLVHNRVSTTENSRNAHD